MEVTSVSALPEYDKGDDDQASQLVWFAEENIVVNNEAQTRPEPQQSQNWVFLAPVLQFNYMEKRWLTSWKG